MTVEKKNQPSNESVLKKINWPEVGLRVGVTLMTAFATGYTSAIGSDLYQTRKLKRVAKKSGNNVLAFKESA